MAIYTTLPNGMTSTAELDAMFDELPEYPEKDDFGNVNELKLAMYHQAVGEFYEARNRVFGDSESSQRHHCRAAAKYYRE